MSQFKPKSHKRGPYSIREKEKRLDDVFKLHFDYGYSAREISESLKISRSTINHDIKKLYSLVNQKKNVFDPLPHIMLSLSRLETQRDRLRKQLDNITSNPEKISFERLILDIESRLIFTHIKIFDSAITFNKNITDWINNWMKNHNQKDRYITVFDTLSVSEETKEKINKIIEEDRSIKQLGSI